MSESHDSVNLKLRGRLVEVVLERIVIPAIGREIISLDQVIETIQAEIAVTKSSKSVR